MSTPTIAEVMATPEFHQNPYPLYARLRDEQPLYRSPHGVSYVSRYADVDKALRDPRLSNDRDRITRAMAAQQGDNQLMTRLMKKLGRVMTNTDPPDHARLRKLVNKAFSAGRTRDFRPQIQAITDRLLDAAEAAGRRMDLITALAYPLTSSVICALVGVPGDGQARVLTWLRQLENPVDAGLTIEGTEQVVDDLHGYLYDLIHRRRAEPTDDVLSALVNVEEGGDRLGDDEIVSACFVLIGSGYETTMNLIANSVLMLLRHAEQLQLLREKPELLLPAIEEVLRYESPSLQVIRVVAEPLEIAGCALEEGTMLSLLLGAANHDPLRFPDAERFDITRADTRHVSFGSGIHFCLGAPLARLEAAVAVGTLLRRFPDLRLDAEPVAWRPNPSLRGLSRLSVHC
ncbi:cytochrome P450 [Chondromyces apiculatus]|uniref:Putative cytochrome P450 hydroxylase n=1 Tax=Chondromyces apiculatus DSM 436 TaxID=1192034 RepID=A0A017SVY0_9BACT|nr:cytochrome P450 [Chondromyces apiculatus]EYF00461.1 putative cytochrome P450 hydroxylase [Chondromyces apiculatus DSM 436]